ncbi:hypothetical protein PINS_up009093 [Pythium insidiosum]|nr:hypothetical protein PINS_up009093 [Pythium insidiosum]
MAPNISDRTISAAAPSATDAWSTQASKSLEALQSAEVKPFVNAPHRFSPVDAGEYALDTQGTPFIPSEHLDIRPPAFVYSSDFTKIPFVPGQRNSTSFAVTEPFRLLSDAGVAAFREVIEQHKDDPRIAQSDERVELMLRGLSFVSPFVNGLSNSEDVAELASNLSGDALTTHSMTTTHGHINVGAATGKVVDPWHLDSVDYVMVVMLTDPATFEGGDLEVVRRSTAEEARELVERGPLSDEDVLTVRFQRAGDAILLLGTTHLHRVTPVFSGREPRLSAVLPFITRRLPSKDLTRYGTFKRKDRFAAIEYGRHKAWRAQGFLSHLTSLSFDKSSVEDVLRDLVFARDELEHAIRVLSGEDDDEMPFFDETSGKFIKRR